MGAGVVVMVAAASAVDPCVLYPGQAQAPADCPQRGAPPHDSTAAAVGLASGAGVALLGGLIYATSFEPSHGATSSAPQSPAAAAPAQDATTDGACSSTEYRAYERSQLCAFTGAGAVCKTRPIGCSGYYAPVCGCDFHTYTNACKANAAGTNVYATGHCP